jgi:hypothetical protein
MRDIDRDKSWRKIPFRDARISPLAGETGCNRVAGGIELVLRDGGKAVVRRNENVGVAI